MKSFKILTAALALTSVMLVSGCYKMGDPDRVFTGIDSSKARATGFAYDDINSSEKTISLYWDADAAIAAGATSFSVQLAKKEDFSDVDMYDSKIGQTIQATAQVYDAAIFSGLSEYDRYYARVRANYPRSIYSEWTVLETSDGQVACISVGHGLVAMTFAAPAGLTAESAVYSKVTASWQIVGLAEGYAPEWKKSTDSEWTVLPETTKVSLEITGTDPETSYDVRVRAFRTVDGAKEYSDYASSTVTTPAKPEFDKNIKTAAQLQEFITSIAATASATDAYTIKNDIDLGGATVTAAVDNFAGSIEGGNFTIKNVTIDGNLFKAMTGSIKNLKFSNVTISAGIVGTVEAGASISGVSLDNTCTVAYPSDVKDAVNFGVVADYNKGTIENCSSAAAFNGTFPELPKVDLCFGGIVGRTEGLVKGCSNTGKRSLVVTAPQSAVFHCFGGVVGLAQGAAGQVIVADCTNEGEVAVEFGTAVYFVVGGVVGGTPITKQCTGDYGVIENCVNKGSISSHYIAGGSGAYPIVGGVAGNVEGYVKKAENFGDISIKCDSESATWTCAKVGGVAGVVSLGAYDCKNHGGFTTDALFAGGTDKARGAANINCSCFAGVIGAAGPYTKSEEVVFEKCVNDANISINPKSITETPNSFYGAVFGYITAHAKDCHNTGAMTVECPIGVNRLGGITGGAATALESCTNTGAMTVVNKNVTSTGWRSFVGGIVGDYYRAGADIEMKDCTNSGKITLDASAATTTSTKTSGVGGLVGCKKEGTTVTFTNCSNTGATTATSGSPVITDNLCGGDYN